MASLWPVEPSGEFCVQQFRKSSLVKWALMFANQDADRDGERQQPRSLCSVEFLRDMLREIVSHGQLAPLSESEIWQEDPVLQRLSVLEWIVRSLRTYFMDVLGQMMIMRCPDFLYMSQFPEADFTFMEMRKLLLLILGFAVQSAGKERIIERIQGMEEDAQKDIVECIKAVTDNAELVELSDCAEEPAGVIRIAQHHVKSLLKDREALIKLVLSLWRDKRQQEQCHVNEVQKRSVPTSSHHSVEIADHKAHIRRITQELYDCGEELKDCKDELKTAYCALDVLKNQNVELNKERGLVKVYRDELDVLYEKEKHSFKVEAELSRCRGQLVELEYHTNRIEELEQNLQLLNDTKNLLEAQLESVRKRTELIPQLEKDLSHVRSNLHNALMDNHAQNDQLKDLAIKNVQLCLELERFRRTDKTEGESEADNDKHNVVVSLSDQLQESLQSKVQRLEAENDKLTTALKGLENCSEKDSAVSTLHTEDAFSSSSSAETEDNLDHEMNTQQRLSRHTRHLEDADVQYLQEQNAYHKAEITALRETCQQYEKLEVKLTESRHNEVSAKRQLYEAEEKIRDLREQQRLDENDKAKVSQLQEEVQQLRKEKEKRDDENVTLQESVRSNDQEIKRLKRACHNKEVALAEVQQTLVETEASLVVAQQEAGKASVSAEKNIFLESQQKVLTQEAATATSKVTELQDQLTNQQRQSIKHRHCLDEVVDFLRATGVIFPQDFDRLEGAEKGNVLNGVLSAVIAKSKQEALRANHDVMRAELENLQKQHELLKVSYEQDVVRQCATSSGPSSISIEATCSSAELDKLTETESLKRQLGETTSLLTTARLQEERLTSGKKTLQTDCNQLQSDNASLRAEVRSFQALNNDLKLKVKSQEKKNESMMKTMETSQEAHSAVMADHEALQQFHGQLNKDYEKVVREVNVARSNNKKLLLDLDVARQEMAKVEREAAERQMRDGDKVRLERLQRLEKEYENLQAENEILRKNNRKLSETYRVLTQTTQTQTTQINQLKIEKIEYEGVVFDCKNQVQSKEIEADKHTEILLGIIASLEDDKRSIAASMERLIQQYDEIFVLTWKEKSQMQSERKELQERLLALNGQKELLIQKLYDTFKNTEARRRSLGFLQRVRRAAGELVGRSRSRSRTRGAISPTDSQADSSSVESNTGSDNKRSHLHSKSLYSIKDTKATPSDRLQSSYSSDDLRKQSSSASSACISPTEMPVAYRSTDTTDSKAPSTITPDGTNKRLSTSSDLAFQRVGSRRGVYQPSPPYATVVVHHPAIRQPQPVPSTPVSKSDSKKKSCCTSSSYGGFHDCSMLNHARLSTTSALSNNSSTSSSSILPRGSPDKRSMPKMQPHSPLNGFASPSLDGSSKPVGRTPTTSRINSAAEFYKDPSTPVRATPNQNIPSPTSHSDSSNLIEQSSMVYASRRYLEGNAANSLLSPSPISKNFDKNAEAWFEYGCV